MKLCWREKIIDPQEIEGVVSILRKEGKTIATLNGSFDLLHAGHLYIISEAKKTADILFVTLNSDESIKLYKSEMRPIIPLKYRLEMMAALEFVDLLTWFHEIDPRSILNRIKPNVHVNGIEYGKNCIESETVIANGGRLHLVDRIPSLSTSDVVSKIQQLKGNF